MRTTVVAITTQAHFIFTLLARLLRKYTSSICQTTYQRLNFATKTKFISLRNVILSLIYAQTHVEYNVFIHV
jgi:hypothetical protein